ncbi:MAG: M20/M25/M40 family metallo-hydrolase, partial [Caulobacteraceae bacterium]|nr:M20/M25/M40 family metallo-hydrolase [Caulobacter sp.]
PPAPRPIGAPSGDFSAARAFSDVQAIGREPHPTGSAAIEPVRRHILQRLDALGVSAAIHAGEGARSPRWAPERLQAAAVQNIVGVLPGRDPTLPAVAVMAHYDSVPNSPGAADDSAGVAAMLEIARSLAADARAGRQSLRDVAFVVTDAEEPGLLGAQAFFASDPLARHLGVVVNMEARGDAGRAAMFQTGPRAGALVRLYARAARKPYAASFTAFFASLLPNDTDFSVAREHGLGGLNLAFIGDQLAYHSPLSTPGHLQLSSLQSLGGQALPAVRALAQAPRLPPPAPDLAYADLPGLGVPAYPAAAGGWIVALVLALLVAVSIARAVRGGWVRASDVVRGAAVAALAGLAAAPLLFAAGVALGGGASLLALYRLLGRYSWMLAGALLLAVAGALLTYALAARGLGRRGRMTTAAALLAMGVLAAAAGAPLGAGVGVAAAALAWFALARPLDTWSAWLGALALGVLLAGVAQGLAPMTAPLLAWPLAPAAVGALGVFAAARSEGAARLALLVAGGLSVAAAALAGVWGAALFEGLGAALPAVAAVPVLLALPALAPFARLSAGTGAGAALAVVAGVLGAGLLAGAALHTGSPARPAASIAFALDQAPAPGAPPDRGWRVAPALDGWTRRVLGPAPTRRRFDLPGVSVAWAVPAPPAGPPAPQATVSALAGRLVISVRPSMSTRELRLRLGSDAALADPRLDARPVAWPASHGVRELRFSAPPPEGVTLSFAAPPHGRAALTLVGVSDGWTPPAPRPPGLMAFGDGDTRMTAARTVAAW